VLGVGVGRKCRKGLRLSEQLLLLLLAVNFALPLKRHGRFKRHAAGVSFHLVLSSLSEWSWRMTSSEEVVSTSVIVMGIHGGGIRNRME